MEKEEMRRGFGLPASAWVAYDPCLAYKNMEGPGPLHVGPGLDGPAPWPLCGRKAERESVVGPLGDDTVMDPGPRPPWAC